MKMVRTTTMIALPNGVITLFRDSNGLDTGWNTCTGTALGCCPAVLPLPGFFKADGAGSVGTGGLSAISLPRSFIASAALCSLRFLGLRRASIYSFMLVFYVSLGAGQLIGHDDQLVSDCPSHNADPRARNSNHQRDREKTRNTNALERGHQRGQHKGEEHRECQRDQHHSREVKSGNDYDCSN